VPAIARVSASYICETSQFTNWEGDCPVRKMSSFRLGVTYACCERSVGLLENVH